MFINLILNFFLYLKCLLLVSCSKVNLKFQRPQSDLLWQISFNQFAV